MPLNRRHFLLGSLSLPALAATKKRTDTARPSIVLVTAEELGAYMLGCYGNTEVQTPQIDRVAQTGVRFQAHFSCAALPLDTAAFGASGYVCGSSSAPAQTAAFLDAQAQGKPFFLTVALPSPNTVTAPQKNLDLYAKNGFESIGWNPVASQATQPEMLRDVPGNLRKYAAAVTTLDQQIGEITAAIHRRGFQDQTLVIFAGSSGYLLGRHGLWGGPGASDPPNLYDEVVRTPLIWSCPSLFPPQTVRNDVVVFSDLMPTICALTGIAAPSFGRSYLNFVEGRPLGKKQTWTDLAYCRFKNVEMARDDRYKVIVRDQGKGLSELYDEKTDPKEQENQFENPKYGSIRDHLTAQLTAARGPAK